MLIDTNVFLAAEREQLDLATIITAHQGESVALAAITASELLHGVPRA
jgi:tRNA(fMet)-specific endonuclease VapC